MSSFESIGRLAKKLPDLQREPQIERAVQKKKAAGERIPNTPEARIGTYLNRLDTVLSQPNEKQRARNLMLLKPFLHDAFVISEADFPDSYFELQKRIYQERGEEVQEFTEGQKQQMIEVVREDQTKSLDDWADYLVSDDAGYPTWFKYLAFRNITKLSQFDKERGHFKKRSKDTVAPFPDIYREALAIVADKLEALADVDPEKLKERDEKIKLAQEAGVEPELSEQERQLPFESFEEFERYGQGRFADLYAEATQDTLSASIEGRENIRGEWVVYEQGDMDGASRLYQSLQGKGTGWCTAGKSTAETQLKDGDFHVYYTYRENSDAIPSIPRIAVRMDGEEIAEVRGVLPNQALEPILQDIVDQKLEGFGDKANSFKKKSEDMRKMTDLEKKIIVDEELSNEEIAFLYEIDSSIEGFGYQKDPRIEQARLKRDFAKDIAAIVEIREQDKTFLTLLRMQDQIPGGFTTLMNSIPLFPDLTQKYILETMIDSGLDSDVLAHLSGFSELSPKEVMTLLIQRGNYEFMTSTLIARPELRKILPLEEALLESFEVYASRMGSELATNFSDKLILEAVKRIPLEDRDLVAKKLTEIGKNWIIAANLTEFPSIDPYELTHSLIEAGSLDIIISNISQFPDDLNSEVLISNAVKTHKGREALAKNLKRVEGMNASISLKIEPIVDVYIESGDGTLLIKYIDSFSALGIPNILQKVSASPTKDPRIESSYFLQVLNKHPECDPNIFLQEIFGDPSRVEEYLNDLRLQAQSLPNLKGALTADTVGKLFGGRAKYRVHAGIVSFVREDERNNLADLLLQHRCGDYVAERLGDYPDLDQNNFFKKIVFPGTTRHGGNTPYYQEAISKFSNLKVDAAELLLLRGDARTLAFNLDKFTGLTEYVARKLIGNGFKYQIATHLDSFTDLLPETLEEIKI